VAEISEVKIGGSANPAVVPHFRRLIAEAAQPVGRDPAEIGIVLGAVCVVDEDGTAARALVRREVALYLPVVADLDPTIQIDPDLLARLRTAAEQYDFEAAAALISDELLGRFAFAGTPAQVVQQAEALFAAGAQRVEFGTPHGLTAQEGLRLLGEQVLPALRPRAT
jgi:5,10-methylenetetrahydromethanopterin reductase